MGGGGQKRKCHFNDNLQKEFPFLKKFAHGGDSETGVRCQICNGTFSLGHGGRSDINQHIKSQKHQLSLASRASSSKVTEHFKKFVPSNEDLQIAAKEAVFAFHTVKHDHSFRSADCTSKLIQQCFEKKYSCSRTKTSAVVTNVLHPTFCPN